MSVCARVAAAWITATASLSTLAAAPAPRWAVDPQMVGEQLPSVGRSLFDYLVSEEKNGQREYIVPFPYTALIQKIEQRLHGGDAAPQVKQVLIPLGRSLQRNAAAPDFFKFPRVVAAIDTEATPRGDQTLLLKDRLYIGFGEKSAVLEVISYNEVAGRFEFQVVNDYRPGGTPRVAYADRAVCMSCHQNAAPIFSRQKWDESNANPDVARLLKKHGDTFHGVAVEHGVDVPFAIDAASQRANMFEVTQLLWREGCGDGVAGDRCRATAFGLALQYRMSGERVFDALSQRTQQQVGDVLMTQIKSRWPGGLLIPDATLANRNPLQTVVHPGASQLSMNDALDRKGQQRLQDLLSNTDIQAPFEPLNPRAPLETWSATDGQWVARLVRGLADFIAVSDAQRLDAHLSGSHAATVVRSGMARCEVAVRTLDVYDTRMAFRCDKGAGRVVLRAGKMIAGEIETIDLDGSTLNALALSPDSTLRRSSGGWTLTLIPQHSQMRARTGTGAVILSLVLTGNGALGGDAMVPVTAYATLENDFPAVWTAIDALVTRDRESFSAKPFRRAAVMPALLTQLGVPPGVWCCVNTDGMPPIVDDRVTRAAAQKD